MTAALTIKRYLDIAPTTELHDAIDAIFFGSSNTQSFDGETARRAFRERWLGRYLSDDPHLAHIALTASGEVVGYLVGALDDPARSPRFADVDYFQDFADLTQHFPAHLHVNLAPEFRNRGIGSRLIEAFIADAQQGSAPGVHVVTAAGASNVRFYNRNGFAEIGRLKQGASLVFLGRVL